jgi:hypothetical protein
MEQENHRIAFRRFRVVSPQDCRSGTGTSGDGDPSGSLAVYTACLHYRKTRSRDLEHHDPGIAEAPEAVFPVKPVGVSRCQKTDQVFQFRISRDAFQHPFSQPFSAEFFQDEKIRQKVDGREIGYYPGETNLFPLPVHTKTERIFNRFFYFRVCPGSGAMIAGKKFVDFFYGEEAFFRTDRKIMKDPFHKEPRFIKGVRHRASGFWKVLSSDSSFFPDA